MNCPHCGKPIGDDPNKPGTLDDVIFRQNWTIFVLVLIWICVAFRP